MIEIMRMVKCVCTEVSNFMKYSFPLSFLFYLSSCTVVCFETQSYINSIGNERLQMGKDDIEYSVYEKNNTYYVKIPVVLVPETGYLFSVQEKYAPFPDFGLGWRDVPSHVHKKGEAAGYAFVRVIPDYWRNTSFYQKFSRNTQEAPNLIFADNFEEDLPILNISGYDDDVRWCIHNNARYCLMGQNKKTLIHYSLYPLQAAFYVVDLGLTLIVNPSVWILYDLPAAICE